MSGDVTEMSWNHLRLQIFVDMPCFGTNYSTTEYEHDISPFYWKSTYYKQGLFVDSTPEYGVRTVGFHILLYINIIPNPKQHVRSPATLNVTSGVVNALALRMTENRDVYWEYRIYATEREPATQMSGDVTEMSWNPCYTQTASEACQRPFGILKKAVLNRLCAPSGARTLDPNIKSVVLYQLS